MHEHPESFDELRAQLIQDPEKVLQDHSTSPEETSYRLYPYPGNDSLNMLGSAITAMTPMVTRDVSSIAGIPSRKL